MKNENSETATHVNPSKASAEQRHYASWVGLVMGLLLPGAAHVLSGQCCKGVLWFAGTILIVEVFFGMLILPGKWFYFGVAFILILSILYKIALLISSWRPVRRIGWLGWVIFLLLVVGVNNFLQPPYLQFHSQYVAELYRANGMSMAPTLLAPSRQLESPEQADSLVVNKMTYRFSEPRRGDIVAHLFQDDSGEDPVTFVHRIVGLPGETIEIESPYVLVDGQKLTNPSIFEKISSKKDGFRGYFALSDIGFDEKKESSVTLGEDEYFILGDHSEFSFDSRMYGPVKRNNILGRVTHIYYPFSRIGVLE